MTEEAAQSHRPGAGGSAGPPPAPAGPAWSASPFGGDAAPPPPGDHVTPPPSGGASFTSRYGLVRPRDGRYLAGVCAAIGRATSTDPVLWRVILAVLGFFGGVGILVYVAAWLVIPGEGDSASPVESMLGRGRSSMSPVTVIVLSILVAVSFGYIVTDAFRAVLLGTAILIGGALLLNRDGRPGGVPAPDGGPPAPAATPPGPVPPVSYPAPRLFAPAPDPVPPADPLPVPAPLDRTAELPAWSPAPTGFPAPADRQSAPAPVWPPTAGARATTGAPLSVPPVPPVAAPAPGGYR
ncbi:PspC domain-containing protein, partial [Micromonospora psammae]|uniref:PspC domain-containing protein n=1 Tax=Micromonospora sp. CPCC 205556 TaxID=3122398 RepID=UPI002FF33E17